MIDNRVSDSKATELAKNVQVLSELGFIGENDENKEFVEAWDSLSDDDKLFYRGWIQGSISAIALNRKK